MSRALPPLPRFWARVQSQPNGCWRWTGAIRHPKKGYGTFSWNGKNVSAHRASFELFKGPIPDGLQIDHLCRNGWCVNPAHLEAVTARVNIYRSEGSGPKNAAKTHCVRGHPYDEANTRYYDGSRYCRTCHRDRVRAADQRDRAAVLDLIGEDES